MSPWQLESVLNVHSNLPLKFHQNRVSNSWDIADIEFVWRSHGLYGEEPRLIWWGLHSHYIVKPNLVLRLGWGFDNKHKKSSKILESVEKESILKRQPYLKENIFHKNECQLLFKLRSRMLDVKTNFAKLNSSFNSTTTSTWVENSINFILVHPPTTHPEMENRKYCPSAMIFK